jgi:hypothetical protein
MQTRKHLRLDEINSDAAGLACMQQPHFILAYDAPSGRSWRGCDLRCHRSLQASLKHFLLQSTFDRHVQLLCVVYNDLSWSLQNLSLGYNVSWTWPDCGLG